MSERTTDALEEALNRIKELEAKLVERDVYEAQQILPPEQAALIKHLATVERCIEEGREAFHGYDIEVRCIFCHRDDEEHAHEKDCAWLALQFDRKPAETMVMVEDWAWKENARCDRERARAMTPRRLGRTSSNDLTNVFKELWPIARVEPLGADEMRGQFTLQPDTHFPDASVPATVTLDEALRNTGREGEPRRARGGEDDEEGVPPVDHRPVDGER